MGRLHFDGSAEATNNLMQVFTPLRTQAVIAATEWAPGGNDLAFLATTDVNVNINGGTDFPLSAYTPIGISPGYTFTFDAPITLLVM